MIITYCFIGTLPDYAVDTVYQARLFYKGPIYFIISDMESSYVKKLEEMQVTIIEYASVIDNDFNKTVEEYNRFEYIHGLKGREQLFRYSFERFFVLYQLMNKYNLSNVFFLELDNLIYDDPLKWEEQFCLKEISYMYDHVDRCASGICFIKNKDILFEFNEYCIYYIKHTNKFLTEMTALYEFWEKNKNKVQILPTHWTSTDIPIHVYSNYDKYNNTIFDSAGLGIYLGGMDPHHTGGVIQKGLASKWSAINYTIYKYEWKTDEYNRKIPYVVHDNTYIKINNLHIHSKDLRSCLSISY